MKSVPQIRVRGVAHVFESEQKPLTALQKIDLDVHPGAFVSVVGPSGGGKTTLLRVIGGLLEPTSGDVLLGGVPPSEARRRKAIGFVFQDPSLLPWRTVIENIALPLQLNAANTAGEADDPKRLVEAVGLAEFRDYYPHQLSGGMRQRVALARSLVHNPSVLLMDEPLGALDEMTRGAMQYELLHLWDRWRKTVVFITHSVAEAVLLSDRVVVMSPKPGRVLDDLEIDLPRPRPPSLERTDRFTDYVRHVKAVLSTDSAYAVPAEASVGH